MKSAKTLSALLLTVTDGYDTVIGEGGATISGGERQRLSIARAMLKDAPIVILDEATANVDPENEAELQAAIEALTGGKTIIMIAHRLKTVRHANQILVVDHGKIVQHGTHDQLIRQKGIYADFILNRKAAIDSYSLSSGLYQPCARLWGRHVGSTPVICRRLFPGRLRHAGCARSIPAGWCAFAMHHPAGAGAGNIPVPDGDRGAGCFKTPGSRSSPR